MNREVKKLIILEILILILFIFISIFSSLKIYNYSKTNFNDNVYYSFGYLSSKYEIDKQDIINSLVLRENYNEGYELLSDYNLDNIYESDLKNKIILNNLIILLVAVFIIFLINIIFIRNNYKKIKKIDLYMNDILAGNYKVDIKDYLEGDISNLKNDTYKMTVKLREQSEALLKDKIYLEELLQDISHQIKTPLTSMYMITDILESEENKKIRKEFIIKNRKELDRLNWLITSLLKISRLDSGQVKFKYEDIKISSLINLSLEPINELIKSKNINIKYNLKNTSLNVDVNWTKEALLNILKNACEHTKDEIIITSSTNPLYTQINIIDNGDGIKESDIPHIFERFYKCGDKESIGIGLNMSKKIIEFENGIVEVTSNVGKTIFTIKFYKR